MHRDILVMKTSADTKTEQNKNTQRMYNYS